MSRAGFEETSGAVRAAMREDLAAVATALSALPDRGAGWVEEGERRLRKALVRGDLYAAADLGQAAGAARMALEERAGDFTTYMACLQRLIEAIGAAIGGEGGADGLSLDLISMCRGDATLRWTTWVWMSVCSATSGSLDQARAEVESAATIARQLDPFAVAMCHCASAGVSFLGGEVDAMDDQIRRAVEIHEAADDARSASRAWMLFARWSSAAGRERAALRAAAHAVELDASCPAPQLFLARRATIAGRADQVNELIGDLYAEMPRRAAVDREVRLARAVERNPRLRSDLARYERTLRGPVTPAVADEICGQLERDGAAPGFDLREILAWDLLAAGFVDRAAVLFRAIVDRGDEGSRCQALDGLASIDTPAASRVGALDLIARRGVHANLTMEVFTGEGQLGPDLFWTRRAVLAGRVEDALKEIRSIAENMTRVAEIERERRMLGELKRGMISQPLAAEFLRMRERPLTPAIVSQLERFADELPGCSALHEILAWDLADAGHQGAAWRIFQRMFEHEIDEETRTSINRGMEQLRRDAELHEVPDDDLAHWRGAPLAPGADVDSVLVRFVCTRQPWPSVLDRYGLLFVTRMEEIADRMASWAEPLLLEAGEYVQRQGEPGWLLALLESGAATSSRTRGEFQDLGPITEGALMGEVGTLWGVPNTVDVRVTTPARLKVVRRSRLSQEIRAGNSDAAALLGVLRAWYTDVVFSINPVMSHVRGSVAEQLSRGMSSGVFHQGELLALQGQPAPFLLILSGLAQVSITMEDAEQRFLGFVCPGDLIGERRESLVTITASTTLTTIPFDRRMIDALPRASLEALRQRRLECEQAISTIRR